MKTQTASLETRIMRNVPARREFVSLSCDRVGLSAWRLPSGKALAEFALEAGHVGAASAGGCPLPGPAPRIGSGDDGERVWCGEARQGLFMSAQLLIAVCAGLVAAVEDLMRRRVSNWICICAFGAGLSCLGV